MDLIRIRGARTHNLKNIDLDLPRHRLVVITGLSGSGKSSLAFDTLYAEGQRRYVESLSTYARQFLQRMEKPDVDLIEGLSPAIAIEQKAGSHNPRSTVGTVTEINDYLRLLYARTGTPYCPHHPDRALTAQTVSEMVDAVLALPEGTRVMILAPLVRAQTGDQRERLEALQAQGFVRVRIRTHADEDHPQGQRASNNAGSAKESTENPREDQDRIVELFDSVSFPDLDPRRRHSIDVVVDRIKVHPALRQRLAESFETALRLGDDRALAIELDRQESGRVQHHGPVAGGHGADTTPAEAGAEAAAGAESGHAGMPPANGVHLFSARFACPVCDYTLAELEPRLFSFNSRQGACPECDGLGTVSVFDPERVVAFPGLSLASGAIRGWDRRNAFYFRLIQDLAAHYGFDVETPFERLPETIRNVVLQGSGTERIAFTYPGDAGTSIVRRHPFEGVIPNLERRWRETDSAHVREELAKYVSTRRCPACDGTRLCVDARCVRVGPPGADRTIHEVSGWTLRESLAWFDALELPGARRLVGERIVREIAARLRFLNNVGLDYLSLDRPADTLSGGESQRIRLASQIGSGLTGVLYVLDEPSIGLHQRDNDRLLDTLRHLRDLGNTVIVVEHDEDAIRAADHVVDLGPGAGEQGGSIVAQGDARAIEASPRSLTGQYLSGALRIEVPAQRKPRGPHELLIRGARGNNLKNIDVAIPLGLLISVTGVSGSGKSTLINDTLHAAAARAIHRATTSPAPHDGIDGLDQIDKVIAVDQSPIGRTPRSNPATYTGLFTPIRELFAETPLARERGYGPGRFSFNLKGGRCEACQGDGVLRVEMHFLPDVHVACEVCGGQRYNRETLEVQYKGHNIAQVLEMTIDRAATFFDAVPTIRRKLETLQETGLGYVRLGQSATTLSGGEAQRVKLAEELSRRDTGRTLYILDEPTTGLHFHDIALLLKVIHALRDRGNTVIVIEHNLDVIKTADWLIDLGPAGGAGGGQVVASGTPEDVAARAESVTGQYLARVLQ